MGNNCSQIPSCPVLYFGSTESAEDIRIKEDVIRQSETVLKTLAVTVGFLSTVGTLNPVLGSVVSIPAGVIAAKEASGFLITYLEQRQNMERLFVKAAIDKSQYQFALSLLNAELTAVSNRRKRIFNIYGPPAEKEIEVVAALHSCEKLFAWFTDETFPFWKIPVESSKYFIAFTAVYLEIITLTLCVLPSYQRDMIHILERIKSGTDKFSQHVVTTRLSFIRVARANLPKIEMTIKELRDLKSYLEEKKRWYWWLHENMFAVEFGDTFPSIEDPQNPDELVPWKYATVPDQSLPLAKQIEAFLSYMDSCGKLYFDQFEPIHGTVRTLNRCLQEFPDSTKSVKSAISMFEKKCG